MNHKWRGVEGAPTLLTGLAKISKAYWGSSLPNRPVTPQAFLYVRVLHRMKAAGRHNPAPTGILKWGRRSWLGSKPVGTGPNSNSCSSSLSSIAASSRSSAWLTHACIVVQLASQATSRILMVATSPVIISWRDSVGTLSWAAKVARTVLGDMGAFSVVTMAAGWYSLALTVIEPSSGDRTEKSTLKSDMLG